MHDYIPDFIIRLKANDGGGHHYLILETKGFDPLEEVKREAAVRWANAVNADGMYGHWQYDIARKPEEVNQRLDAAEIRAVVAKTLRRPGNHQ
jgi:type III restriction enzyme